MKDPISILIRGKNSVTDPHLFYAIWIRKHGPGFHVNILYVRLRSRSIPTHTGTGKQLNQTRNNREKFFGSNLVLAFAASYVEVPNSI
jgi:hypothetical protein